MEERRGKVTEPPTITRKHRPTKSTRWAVMINGKQVGELKDTIDDCYNYIEKCNLSSKLPEIKRIN